MTENVFRRLDPNHGGGFVSSARSSRRYDRVVNFISDMSQISTSFQCFIAKPHDRSPELKLSKLFGGFDARSENTVRDLYRSSCGVQLDGGPALHSLEAKVLAANREDIISTLVAGLPAAGNGVCPDAGACSLCLFASVKNRFRLSVLTNEKRCVGILFFGNDSDGGITSPIGVKKCGVGSKG
ncbi:hypothetical protein [Agrobacterium tumefaciens]|uniref:hypothetical protein n=1 Tax=Agrobacterium tumefaciens TaxID=358 RepID=UPI0021CF72AC|nr:hypothetical protein [Agrobacterium tumefaciens]